MLIYIDESGDCGMKDRGSTAHFTLAAVAFETAEQANACGDAIAQVRRALGVSTCFEFHFARIGDARRAAFLQGVAPCSFFFAACTINKSRLSGDSWKKKSFFF